MDNNIIVRDGSTDLTADETIADIHFLAQINVFYLIVIVPEAVADTSLLVKANFVDASNNVLQTNVSKSIAAAGVYALPLFCDDPALSDLSVVFDVTGEGADFGAVKSYFSVARLS